MIINQDLKMGELTMKKQLLIGIMATMLLLPGISIAQEPPANYGELAALMVEFWQIPDATDPGDDDPNIAALDEIGIGPAGLAPQLGISTRQSPPGLPLRFSPDQELTNFFLCQLHTLTWASAEIGLIDYFGPESGTTAVLDLISLHKRLVNCAAGKEEQPPSSNNPPPPDVPEAEVCEEC